jgi:MFS family permease
VGHLTTGRDDAPDLPFLLWPFFFGGFACSAFYPLTVSIASRRFPGQEGWISGVVFTGLATGTGLGSVLPAAVRPWLGLAATYRWMAVFPALCLILALRVGRREPRS